VDDAVRMHVRHGVQKVSEQRLQNTKH
jgi:hypothetical protein